MIADARTLKNAPKRGKFATNYVVQTNRSQAGEERMKSMRPSGYFLTLITVFSLSTGFPGFARAASNRLLEFTAAESEWVVVNDGVMGGVSSSGVKTVKGVMTFSGRVRLENNGGFASARSTSATKMDSATLASARTVSVRVRGDGKTYQLTFDTGSTWFWATITPPAGKWTTVPIPYADLRPRGRFGDALDSPPYAGQPLRSIGLLIGNNKPERFTIALDWISAP